MPKFRSDADALFSPDARKSASGSLRMRAERLQTGTGRVYLVVTQAADSATNTRASCATVVVPHDQSAKSLAVVDALAAPAQARCAGHNSAAPVGYVTVVTDSQLDPNNE